jgi:uncharacterized Fe-S radical SAM superfamily protein PflX
MESEALRNLRTMRQIRTGTGLARDQKLRTTNSLSKTKEEVEHLQSLSDPRVGQILAEERKRFAAQEVAIEKSRRRVLKSREKLAVTINKNCALTELRHELQRTRWEGRDPVPTTKQPSTAHQYLKQMELRY